MKKVNRIYLRLKGNGEVTLNYINCSDTAVVDLYRGLVSDILNREDMAHIKPVILNDMKRILETQTQPTEPVKPE